MLLATGNYTVLKGGYEHTMPLVAQIYPGLEDKKVLGAARKSPDFVVIQKDDKYVYLVEIKYRHTFDIKEIIDEAQAIHIFWPHTHLFVATNAGFFMDTCENVIEKSFIPPLSEDIVLSKLQKEYLDILKQFLRKEKASNKNVEFK